MGCYDTVKFDCPSCGGPMSRHSKAGDCNLVDYDCAEVPLGIAADLDGVTLYCPHCACKWEIRVAASPTVPVYLAAEDD